MLYVKEYLVIPNSKSQRHLIYIIEYYSICHLKWDFTGIWHLLLMVWLLMWGLNFVLMPASCLINFIDDQGIWVQFTAAAATRNFYSLYSAQTDFSTTQPHVHLVQGALFIGLKLIIQLLLVLMLRMDWTLTPLP